MAFFKIMGVLGIVLLVIGIINKKRKIQDIYYMLGGILLLIYSIYIKDIIFIVLQIIFTLTAIYNLIKNNHPNKK